MCVLFFNIHQYSHVAFVESKNICLRYIACVVTAFSLHHCSMPLESMYNVFLDMYRYVVWHQTFYSTPCPFSSTNQVWLPRYSVNCGIGHWVIAQSPK